ncbi:AidA/PixA family protein [Kordia jejudonensis]|uniref:AidA/PixA family protein n=1 Tax=Kordia jejudonensis TaxID=1348245 RepID=UPI000629BC6F|nr:AidA/PixA family protein [Kordia jejudonensis]
MGNKNFKTWTINVLVNTKYIASLSGKGTWEYPIGGSKSWNKNVTMTATNDDDNDHRIFSGIGDNFSLSIKPGDKVRWILNEINPLVDTSRTVCMYGFKQNSTDWNKYFTPIASVDHEMLTTTIDSNAFNQMHESENYLHLHRSNVSVPQTTARVTAKSGSSVTYFIKLLLIDETNKKVLKYAMVDPKLTIE